MERMRKGGRGAEVLVVGAGVVGCAVARAIARRGRDVVVLDRGRPGSEASWAAGGMLSPLGEASHPGPFLDLALRSLARYPRFVEELEEESGVRIGLSLRGKLLLADGDAEEARLRERMAWQAAEGFGVEWLDDRALRALEPAVASRITSGLLLPRDGTVDNRALVEALWRAAQAWGCRLRPGVEARRLLYRSGRVAGVQLDEGRTIGADVVILAAGAWTGRMGGLPREVPVRPVRGQMFSVGGGAPLLQRVVAGPGAYLIPRAAPAAGAAAGHQVVVGATVEEVGFRPGTTEAAIDGLRKAAAGLVPALAPRQPLEIWSGLRPGTPDDLPLLGRDPEVRGLFYATGHFRNGILLAPETAEIVASAVCDEEPADPAFRPDRF